MGLDVTKELSQNFIEYAAAVNTDRAIPDAKSGLKPVAKRILYGAYLGGRSSNKAHVKCARVVGDVMGALHPHGDSSIYGALVRLSQDWVMRYPLLDFHGNMGNIGGDGPAAYRYTETRLSKLAEDGLLQGLKKRNVDFVPNYDETIEEPITLPAIFPNLLCNPNSGIGVAMACMWAPHNLREVATAINDYLDGKTPTLPGPDFPTGGVIINKKDLSNIIKTGKGTVKVRGKYKVDGNNIIFYEIPYGTSIENILSQIGELCDKEEINNIVEIRDETNKKGIRIVIETNGKTNYVINQLFAKTSLQNTFSYNQVALVDKVPTELGLEDCIKIYVNHNIDCIKRESLFDLEKAKARLEIVEGLLIALEDIDNVIKYIKESENSIKAKEKLVEVYNLSEPQAKAIVDMRLGRLAGLEQMEIKNEKEDLISQIEELNALINSEDIQKQELRKRLDKIVEKYGDERRTEITQLDIGGEEKEIAFVEPEKCVVITAEGGLIKRVPSSSFRTQKRNGKGVKIQDDITSCVIRTNTIDSLMIFSNKGNMYRLLVDSIPSGTNTAKGKPIKSLIDMNNYEEPSVIYSIYRDTDAKYVLFVTKKGIVKKTTLEEYIKTKKKSGLSAINIREGDELAAVTLIKDEDLIIVTKNGMCIKFNSQDITSTGRSTTGVKGINLLKDDEVVAILPIRDKNDKLAIFSDNGVGKKINLSELVLQKRGGRGIACYKVNGSNGHVADAALISDEDNILICGVSKSICVSAKEIPTLSRTSLGNQILKGNKLISVSKV